MPVHFATARREHPKARRPADRLPRASVRNFETALVAGFAAVIALAFGHLFIPGLVLAALLVPFLTVLYLYDVDPGDSFPYHYEYVEEWLLVLDGAVAVRTPQGEHGLQRGDLVRYPPGPEGAHQITNRSDTTARVLLFSKAAVPAVSVYPDTDTIGVWPDDDTEYYFKRDTAVSRDVN